MYEKKYTFRYSDSDSNGNIKVSTVLDLLQDVSTAHSASAGYDLKKLLEIQIAFVLKGWRIRFLQPLAPDDEILVRTGITKIRHFEGVRIYEIWQSGICKVVATGIWMCIDLKKLEITAMPPEIIRAYGAVDEPDNGLPYKPFRNKEQLKLLGEKRVQKRDVDTNQHLNNAKSVELALEFLPQAFSVSELQVTYRQAFLPDETIYFWGGHAKSGAVFELKNANNDLCVTISVK